MLARVVRRTPVCTNFRNCLTSAAYSTSVDRKGVFFSPEDFPITGKQANERTSPHVLRETIAKWRTKYAPCGALTPDQHAQYFDQGWVIVHDLIPKNVLQKAIDSVNGLVSDIADRLYAMDKIRDKCEGADFHTRLIEIERQFAHANVLLHKNGVLPPGIQDTWSHPSMMGVASQLLGIDTDISGHPVWNLRCKTPESLSGGQATVPWHQDTSYLDEECWDKHQVTAWVPLLDTNMQNGCMQVVKGGHLSGLTANHACCVGGTWYTEVLPEELEATLGCNMDKDVITCEVPFGSVLFLNNLIPHRSLANFSQSIRWTLDLRWQRSGEPNGFHGLKDSVLMKRAGPMDAYSGTVNWMGWASEDRTQAQFEALREDQREILETAGRAEGRFNEIPELDTTIAGPWMHRWDLIHHNRHTANLDPAGGMHGWGGGHLEKTV